MSKASWSKDSNTILFSEGGIPFFCGGRTASMNYTDVCYKYVASEDQWIYSGHLFEVRAYSGYVSLESWGLVVAGGYDGGILSSVETTYNGVTFGHYPDMPTENYKSCLVVIDEDRLFTCGIRPGSNRQATYIFNRSADSWISLAPMPTSRYDHSCGLIMHPELGPEVVVAGGYDSEYLDTADIYTVNTDSWREGNLQKKWD